MTTDANVNDPFSSGLSSETRALLESSGTRRRYPAKSFLFHEGDPAVAAFVVEEGLIRVERTRPNGRCVLLTLTSPGSFLGELAILDNEKRSATAATVTDARLLSIPAKDFAQLVEQRADLSNLLLRQVCARMRSLTDQLMDATTGSAAGRVASRLVELLDLFHRDSAAEHGPGESGAKGMDRPIEMRLPITQEELAQWAGLSREGAVGGLRELREQGILTTGRRKITIDRPAELRRWARGSR